MLVLGCVVPAAREAPGGEKADAGCPVKSFRYAQLCTQLLKSQGSPPGLLDDARRRQTCRDMVAGDDSLARLEVLVDRQGRLVRARVVDLPGPCAAKCLEHAFGLAFSPASVGGIPTMRTTTVVCRPAPAEEVASERPNKEGSIPSNAADEAGASDGASRLIRSVRRTTWSKEGR
jgi:hypothetical protein